MSRKLLAGTSVGPYRIVRQLGAGAMGVVWLADDPRLQRSVALKTVKAADAGTAEGRLRLMREARAAAALNHSHIAAVHDVLDIDGQVIVVFEYVEGDTLAARLQRGPLPVAAAVEIGWQLADALAAAHAHGVIHRDLNTSNVVVGPDGRVKVLDFGIARLTAEAGAPAIAGGGLVGTPGYAAPEQHASHHVDHRADLYALGVILFEMVTGSRPFAGSDAVQLASSVQRDEAPPISASNVSVPPALEALVAQLLEREPAKRPGSSHEVMTALILMREHAASPLAQRIVRPRRHLTTRALVAAAVGLALVAAAMLWLW